MPKAKKKVTKKSASLSRKKIKNSIRWLKRSLTIFFILVVLAVAGFFYQSAYADKVLPKVKMGQLSLGSLTLEEAREALDEEIAKVYEEGFTYIYRDEVVIIEPEVVSTADPDITYTIYNYDQEATWQKIYDYGRSNKFLTDWGHRLLSLWQTKNIEPVFTLDQAELVKILKLNFNLYETPAVDAKLTFVGDDPGVTSANAGLAFDYQQLGEALNQAMLDFSDQEINLLLQEDQPEVIAELTGSAQKLAAQLITLAPLSVRYQDYHWLIDKEQLKNWLAFQPNPKTDIPTIGFNKAAEAWLEEISQIVNIEVQEGKFQMEGDRVIEFQPSQIGLALQIEATLNLMTQDIILAQGQQTGLVAEEVLPQVATEQINTYGIKEIIGRGTSDFSGSPQNRRHNIAIGADTLNGLLIEPEQEFSLVGALGTIDASTGYLPELVIKGNKTVPEYGGGLCQIGTTAFRVALDAGLPITARSPHSYRVSYYEPAGTDATIYDPNPDLKFINDTGNYILFITKIEGNDLIFEFYGTGDGRQVTQTEPRLYNFVKPGPTKIVETEDLAPGQRKCTERAHTGADAQFTRTITTADGQVNEEVWESHYKPWQEVCLLGVEPGSLAQEEEETVTDEENEPVDTNTNTNSNTNTNTSSL